MPKPPAKAQPQRKIFISYSHKDIVHVRTFLEWLRPLCKRLGGCTEAWIDYEVLKGGDEWNDRIADGIAAGNIFIVMMSLNFVNSKFCMHEELPRILKKQAAKQARVIGVALGPLLSLDDFQVEVDGYGPRGIAAIQCLPQSDRQNGGESKLGLRAVLDWPKHRDAWFAVAKQLEDALVGARDSLPNDASGPPQVARPSEPLLSELPSSLLVQAPRLPFLADRSDQTTALMVSLKPWLRSGFKRPMVVLTEGRDDDCLTQWVERIRDHEFALALNPGGQSFGDFLDFAWPDSAGHSPSIDDALSLFETSLATRLGPNALADVNEVAAAYAQRQKPTLLWMQCKDSLPAKQARQALLGLMKLFRQWPDLGAGSKLVLAITLLRQADDPPGGRARLAEVFETALLEAQAGGAIQAAPLRSLPELDEYVITNWARTHVPHRAERVPDFCRTHLPQKPPALPMRAFAEKASAWILGT